LIGLLVLPRGRKVAVPESAVFVRGIPGKRVAANLYHKPLPDAARLQVAAEKLIRDVIHQDGGPLIHNGWEEAQTAFDSTCPKFYRFLTQSHH
jgi:hypothetical protein